MGLFSRRPKVSTEEFCRDFYDKSIFAPDIAGTDPWQSICETVYRLIAEADPTFRSVDLSLFYSELQVLRLEVFAIAWLLSVDVELSIIQSEFTKRYLEERGYGDIWEAMEDYNQGVANATFGGQGQAYVSKLNLRRVKVFDKWAVGYEGKVVARVANRLGSDQAFKSMRVHTYLSFVLTDRLGCEVNEEARLVIWTTIQGFYNGATEAIKKVKIVA